MKIITSLKEMQHVSSKFHQSGKMIGFIPTMGALHEGHLSLIKKSNQNNDVTVVSIFVNPMQFNDEKDLELYPRTLKQDSKYIQDYVDILFAPSVEELYPDQFQTKVRIGKIGSQFEGEFRSGYFEGMATVVLKLFNICQPTHCYFGQKDYQQVLIVRQMIHDFNLPITLVMMPTVREKNGLAMSSRNRRLSQEEKKKAAIIYRTLQQSHGVINHGSVNEIEEYICDEIQKKSDIRIEYIAICNSDDLSDCKINHCKEIVILIAAYVGNVRLIDNILISL